MVTVMGKKTSKHNFCIIGATFIVNANVVAAEVEINPVTSGRLTFTDNRDLTPSNKKSEIVGTISAGVAIDAAGNEGNLTFNYEANQTIHSSDSDRNELYNELALSADKSILDTNLTVDAQAGITNISRSIEDNANSDFITGDTIETKQFGAGVSYQSNPSGYINLYSRVDGQITSNEDDIGDFYSYGASLILSDGSKIKNYFWLVDYTFNENISNNTSDSNNSHVLTQELGLQPINGLSPFVRFYYEEYNGINENDSGKFGSWGPALRYYWHERSYIEVSREISIYSNDEDYWRGALRLNPTPRTLLTFEYSKRFFGDAYDFTLSHQNRKVTNTISYTEEPSSFDRRFFVDGENIEELRLTRNLSWESNLLLRRSSLNLVIRGQERESISDQSNTQDDRTYGFVISGRHNLSRKSSTNLSFQYDKYEFDSSEQDKQTDYYRTLELGYDYRIYEDVSMIFSVQHTDRSSSNSERSYDENRANIEVRMKI
ncbi:TIGR03016 family PEP-CTERM system-associated outer membrane protein [Photobacterium sp. BZF1]|uniref:TIGR03016 family PEP-CTERM system-associated outer membrane protein n=1 Tax=Photobacterium sp. BZF1 TaxID=1904457 RepID=UPI001653BDFC|nr:TIGR03016 family PEP-CTERM system-associated outer membrane protein [Photobacterium sp. BZF1]MBC7004731.1 TIGR03016 family PEP-CTERM system-associated outer membrane protein [Photobacterium sp. BZF1]